MCLTLLIRPPTHRSVIRPQTARMVASGADANKRSCRRIRLAVAVCSPASNRPVRTHPTRVAAAGTHGNKRTRWRVDLAIVIQSPAGDGSIRSHPACVASSYADTTECADWRWLGLDENTLSPTHDRLVGTHAACPATTGADSAEGVRRRVSRPVAVCSPTGDGVVKPESARVQKNPALTARKVPDGGSTSPPVKAPQHSTESSGRIPHE